MIPFLTYPLALIALATVPALAAIYILRNRFRRKPVSSLVLWQFHVQSKSGGAKVHRLQLPLLFFLELLALVLLVTAASGPRWKLPQSSRPLIVVLDDSFSMHAVSDGLPAQARAKRFLEQLFRRSPPPDTRLLVAGLQPRALGAAVATWGEVDGLLGQWKCGSPSAALDSALTLAAELGRQQANILVLTDHPPEGKKITNPRLEWHAFGAPAENVAIVNASRTAFGDQDRCLLEIANYAAGPRSARLQVQTGSNALQNTALSLASRETRRLVFNVPGSVPLLRASLEADSLPDDNEVLLLPPIRKRVRVRVGLTNELSAGLVNRTLDSTGLRAAISDQPELVIHETDAFAGSNSWSLYWSGEAATNAYTGPFLVDTSHPLAAGLALDGVVWSAAPATNAPGEVPVVFAGNVPLLSAREEPDGRRRLKLNFNPALSTLQNTPGWPIVFWNILSWRIAEMPGLKESNARLGAEVRFKTSGESVSVTRPDGTTTVFPKTGGELALETPLPGIYSVAAVSPVPGASASTNLFSVNVFSADKSDLSNCASGRWGTWAEDTERRAVESSVVWVFGLFALGLLAAHLWLVAGAKGAT